MRLKLTLEYDGTDFHGWAAQPELRTVEGVVRDAFRDVYPRFDKLAVAGRTDTGVHARGNVVSVDVDGGPPAERASERAERGPSRRRCGGRGGRGGRGLPRTPLREVPQLPVQDLAPARAVAVRAATVLVVCRARSTKNGSPTRPICCSASTTSVRSRRRKRSTRCSSGSARRVVAPARRRARVRDHGRQFPAAHGPALVGTMIELPPEQIAPLLAGRPRSGRGLDSAAVRALYSGR